MHIQWLGPWWQLHTLPPPILGLSTAIRHGFGRQCAADLMQKATWTWASWCVRYWLNEGAALAVCRSKQKGHSHSAEQCDSQQGISHSHQPQARMLADRLAYQLRMPSYHVLVTLPTGRLPLVCMQEERSPLETCYVLGEMVQG